MSRDLAAARNRLDPLYREISRVLVGQSALVDRLVVCLLTGGHALLEGVPGLAKTLVARTLSAALHLTHRRISFTPDLLPADVVGTQIYNPRSGEFTVKHGPVFAQIVLADEINRAPAKVQSALLEAMQERRVTIGETTFALPEPFLVIATQNPIEQEGTYPLPEAQLDRFMMKLRVGYPSREEDLLILSRMSTTAPDLAVTPVLEASEILSLRDAIDAVRLDERLQGYVVDLVRATRKPSLVGLDIDAYVRYGASPRGYIALALAAKARAFLAGRDYVLPEDVKELAADVLAHRIGVSYEAEAEEVTAADLVSRVLDRLAVP